MSGDGLRYDGRTASQIRRVLCETKVLSRADGSAQWSQEGTCVLVAVYGPVETTISKGHAEQASIEVVFKPRAGLAGTIDKQYEHIIRKTVEGVVVAALHPRTLIQIVLQVISGDGSILSCALNGVCAALIDAGLPMKDIYAAVTVCLGEDGQLLMDPTLKEEQDGRATGCFAYSVPSTADDGASRGGTKDAPGLLTLFTQGRMSAEEVEDTMQAGWRGSQRLAESMRTSIGRAFAPV